MRRSAPDRERRRLRLVLGAFFLALALPSAALVYRAYDQLKWESFRRQQLLAEELAGRIDRRLAELAQGEDARPPSDYGFLAPRPDGVPGRRSPLSEYPIRADIPGLVGWFQVDEQGRLSTPLVPEGAGGAREQGLDPSELASRQALAARIEGVLIGNRLLERAPPEQQVDGRPLAETAKVAKSDRRASYADAVENAAAPLPTPRARLSQEAFDRLSAQPKDSDSAWARAKPSTGGGRSEGLAGQPATGTGRLARKESEIAPDLGAQSVKGLGRVEELALDPALAERLGASPVKEESKAQGSAAPLTSTAAAPVALAPASAPPLPAGPPAPGRRSAPGPESPAKVTGEPLGGSGQRRDAPTDSAASAKVGLFGNAVDPIALGLLGSGHFVLFRSARRGGERLVQGLLIEQGPFLASVMEAPFRGTPLAETTDLIVAYRDQILAAFRARPERGYVSSARELTGALLYRTRPREPFGGLELIFSIGRLPIPPGGAVVAWVGGLLALVLAIGTWLLYRLGLRQTDLMRQQQAFVSAVSHELKTPLTSIRMYAEMLRAGFADDQRRQLYYRYIQEESERLSRLIANVLALSRIGRDALAVSPQDLDLGDLLVQVRERVAAPVERAGFRLDLDCGRGGAHLWVRADPDALIQILINLVDNAVKFAARSDPKRIEIRCDRPRDGWVRIGVRDYGPGVPRELRRQVFELFYRGPDAGARAIPGTGIGLALVQRLTQAMGGRVELAGCDPGVEVRLELPSAGA